MSLQVQQNTWSETTFRSLGPKARFLLNKSRFESGEEYNKKIMSIVLTIIEQMDSGIEFSKAYSQGFEAEIQSDPQKLDEALSDIAASRFRRNSSTMDDEKTSAPPPSESGGSSIVIDEEKSSQPPRRRSNAFLGNETPQDISRIQSCSKLNGISHLVRRSSASSEKYQMSMTQAVENGNSTNTEFTEKTFRHYLKHASCILYLHTNLLESFSNEETLTLKKFVNLGHMLFILNCSFDKGLPLVFDNSDLDQMPEYIEKMEKALAKEPHTNLSDILTTDALTIPNGYFSKRATFHKLAHACAYLKYYLPRQYIEMTETERLFIESVLKTWVFNKFFETDIKVAAATFLNRVIRDLPHALSLITKVFFTVYPVDASIIFEWDDLTKFPFFKQGKEEETVDEVFLRLIKFVKQKNQNTDTINGQLCAMWTLHSSETTSPITCLKTCLSMGALKRLFGTEDEQLLLRKVIDRLRRYEIEMEFVPEL